MKRIMLSVFIIATLFTFQSINAKPKAPAPQVNKIPTAANILSIAVGKDSIATLEAKMGKGYPAYGVKAGSARAWENSRNATVILVDSSITDKTRGRIIDSVTVGVPYEVMVYDSKKNRIKNLPQVSLDTWKHGILGKAWPGMSKQETLKAVEAKLQNPEITTILKESKKIYDYTLKGNTSAGGKAIKTWKVTLEFYKETLVKVKVACK